MDFLGIGMAAVSTAASAEPARATRVVRRKMEDGTPQRSQNVDVVNKEIRAMIENIAKLTLQNAQQMLMVRACVFDVLIVQEAAKLYEELAKASKAYSEHMRCLPKEEQPKLSIGLPPVHRWNACLKHLMNTLGKSDKKVIQQYIASVEKIQPEVRMEHFCTRIMGTNTAKAWKKGANKLEVSVDPGSEEVTLWRVVVRPALIAKEKCPFKMGQAPCGDLENRLQEALAEMGEDM